MTRGVEVARAEELRARSAALSRMWGAERRRRERDYSQDEQCARLPAGASSTSQNHPEHPEHALNRSRSIRNDSNTVLY